MIENLANGNTNGFTYAALNGLFKFFNAKLFVTKTIEELITGKLELINLKNKIKNKIFLQSSRLRRFFSKFCKSIYASNCN